jgi:hypothetical protein
MTPNDQRFSREGADVWPPTGERQRRGAQAGPTEEAVGVDGSYVLAHVGSLG